MDFGLAIDFGSSSERLRSRLDRVIRLLRTAEGVGFTSVSVGESYPVQVSYAHLSSPLLLIAALCRETRLRLWTGVTLIPAWNPLRLAYESALLDQLTEGRFVLGVGAGSPLLWRRFGVAAEQMATRLDETIIGLRQLWSGASHYQGSIVEMHGPIYPLPYSPGGPPILIGGRIRRAAERAAALGAGWYASTNYTIDDIERQVAHYREAAGRIGTNVGVIAVNRITAVGETSMVDRQAGPALESIVQRYGMSTKVLDADNDSVLLVGTPGEINRRIAKYAERGVTHIQFRVWLDDMPFELVQQSVELLGSEVLPQWRPHPKVRRTDRER